MFLLEALGDNLFLCLFQLLPASPIPWLLAPSSILTASTIAFSNLSLILTSLRFSLSIVKDPCGYVGLTQIL